MIEKVSGLFGEGRAVAVGSVLAVAVVGMLVTVFMAGAIGRESPQVAPIVIDSSGGGESSDKGVDEDAQRLMEVDEDRRPPPVSSAPGSVDSTASSGGGARSGPDSTQSGPDSTQSGPDSTQSGPVSTAPPPPPITVAPPVPGGGDPAEPDEDNDPEDPDGSDGEGSEEDD